MKNNLENLNSVDKETLSASTKIKEFNGSLYSFPFKMIEYVRNARDMQDAEDRAALASHAMFMALNMVFGPIEREAHVIAEDPTLDIDTTKAALRREAYAKKAAKCPPGMIWDPVTETCVLGFALQLDDPLDT